MTAGIRFDGQMNALMSLQIVVSVKALYALVTLERSVVCGLRLVLLLGLLMYGAVHVLHVGRVATVVARHHAV